MARPHASCRIAQESLPARPSTYRKRGAQEVRPGGKAKARFRPIDPLVPPAANVRNLRIPAIAAPSSDDKIHFRDGS